MLKLLKDPDLRETLGDLATMTCGRMYNTPIAARGVEAFTAEIARGLRPATETQRGQSEGQFSDGRVKCRRTRLRVPEDSRVHYV